MRKIFILLFHILLFASLSAQQYRLVLPKDNYVNSDSNIVFRWSVVDSANQYEVQVATDVDFTNVVYNPPPAAPTTKQSMFAFGSTYYWRIRAWQGVVPQAWSYYRNFSVFRPSQLPGLVMWFDAAKNVTSSGGVVSQWKDLSPSALVATQANVAQQPTIVFQPLLCGKPTVRFDGTGVANTADYLAFSPISLTDYTAFIFRAYNSDPALYMQYVIGGPVCGLCADANFYSAGFGSYSNQQGANALYASLPSAQVSLFGVFTTQRDHVFRNGLESIHAPANANFSNSSIPGLTLSALGTRPDNTILSYRGGVGEIVLCNTSLDSATRNLTERYLRYKFVPPVDLGPDTVFSKFCVSATLTATGCFTSYLWSTGATTASINVTALGTYWVRAKDACGYTSSDTINLRPQIRFNQLPHNITLCTGDSVQWNTGYPATGYQITWSTGATTPSITIKTTGSYFVKIKDAFNCYLYSDTVHVYVDTFPNHTIGPDTSFCSGNRLNFVYPNPLESILWSNGDTTNETVINTTGDYSVMAVNSNGCIARDTIHANIKGIAPAVNFANPVLCATDTVLFLGDSTPPIGNSIILWVWDFGNGSLDTSQNVTHLFQSNGIYPVSLTAYTDSGCLNTISKNLSVYLKPQTNFQSKVACALAQTQFLDFSAPASSIALWKWHFANLDSSILKNPKFAFPAPGKYEVVLKTTNNAGCSNYKSDSVEVFAPLSANFSFQNVCLGDSTMFTDITSSLSLVSWLWNTGDNYLSSKKNLKHKYAASGNYSVTLQIQNAIGCIDSASQTVSIYKKPVAAFGDLITCEDQYYSPLDSSVLHEAVNIWKWNINGGNYSIKAPQHFFPDTGTYNVKLMITSQSGCKDSTNHLVHVTPNPTADFTFTPLYGDAPLTSTFTNQSINATSYFWNFGDGISDIATNPVHTYSTNNTYPIKLLAFSEFGCKDSMTKSITVVHTNLDISVDAVITDESPQTDGTVLVSVTGILSNVGTRLITTVKLYATIGSGGVISEDWDTLIQTGTSKYYPFTAHFVVATANANSYVCVEAKSVNNGETETTIDNNRACVSLNGVLQLIGPSPNPARGSAYLGLILPKAGKVTIAIADLLGRTVVPEEELDLPVGRSDYNLPVKMLRAGEYFIRVKHNDDNLLQKLVVH